MAESTIRMVDIAAKPPMRRTARARAVIRCSRQTVERIRDGSVPKGDVIAVARVAAIQAAKATPVTLPLCHPIGLTSVDIDASLLDEGIAFEVEVGTVHGTGCEMEALCAASTAVLTAWDMCKGIDETLHIDELSLLFKRKETIER